MIEGNLAGKFLNAACLAVFQESCFSDFFHTGYIVRALLALPTLLAWLTLCLAQLSPTTFLHCLGPCPALMAPQPWWGFALTQSPNACDFLGGCHRTLLSQSPPPSSFGRTLFNPSPLQVVRPSFRIVRILCRRSGSAMRRPVVKLWVLCLQSTYTRRPCGGYSPLRHHIRPVVPDVVPTDVLIVATQVIIHPTHILRRLSLNVLGDVMRTVLVSPTYSLSLPPPPPRTCLLIRIGSGCTSQRSENIGNVWLARYHLGI